MVLITENCPLVALIKSYCVNRKVLISEAGETERGVSCSWSFILSAGPVGPTGSQMVSGDQWPQATGTEAYQFLPAFGRWRDLSLRGVVPLWRFSVVKRANPEQKLRDSVFPLDDIKCYKGEKSVFCSCCSEALLQLYALIVFRRLRRPPSCYSAPQYFGAVGLASLAFRITVCQQSASARQKQPLCPSHEQQSSTVCQWLWVGRLGDKILVMSAAIAIDLKCLNLSLQLSV